MYLKQNHLGKQCTVLGNTVQCVADIPCGIKSFKRTVNIDSLVAIVLILSLSFIGHPHECNFCTKLMSLDTFKVSKFVELPLNP